VLFPSSVELCHMIYYRIYMLSSIIQKWHTPITFILTNYITLIRVKHNVFIIIQDHNSFFKYAKHHRDTLGCILVWNCENTMTKIFSTIRVKLTQEKNEIESNVCTEIHIKIDWYIVKINLKWKIKK